MRRLTGAVVMSVAASVALVLGSGSGGAATTLFTSTTPGFQASAATVPAGVCFVTITADGGRGATGQNTFGQAGVGATVSGRVAVPEGSTLSVQVGGAGSPTGAGGSGGGGASGPTGGPTNPFGGGGGASAVSVPGSGPLVVAGGGGGASVMVAPADCLARMAARAQ